MGVIYKFTNKINGKSYIGHTNNFQRRLREHRNAGAHPETYYANKTSAFYAAIKKYGFENFTWEILEECSDDLQTRRELEKYYIKLYGTFGNGYNLTSGGEDSEALDRWRKNNPEKIKAMALKNMEACQKWCQEHREEQLAQLASVRQKGVDATKKKVICLEHNIVFDSLADAERWSLSDENPNGKKASHQHISKVCRGQRNTAGGYHWQYA